MIGVKPQLISVCNFGKQSGIHENDIVLGYADADDWGISHGICEQCKAVEKAKIQMRRDGLRDDLPMLPDAPPEFVGIIADRRTIKTNMMTYFLHDAYVHGKPVIANYHLNFPHTYMSFQETVEALSTDEGAEKIRNAVIGWDELSEAADAYKFLSKESNALSRTVSQLGKVEGRVYYTEQRLFKIAKRLRSQTDIIIVCEKTGIKGIADCTIYNGDMERITEFTFDGRSIWPLYDDKEIIKGVRYTKNSNHADDSDEEDEFF